MTIYDPTSNHHILVSIDTLNNKFRKFNYINVPKHDSGRAGENLAHSTDASFFKRLRGDGVLDTKESNLCVRQIKPNSIDIYAYNLRRIHDNEITPAFQNFAERIQHHSLNKLAHITPPVDLGIKPHHIIATQKHKC